MSTHMRWMGWTGSLRSKGLATLPHKCQLKVHTFGTNTIKKCNCVVNRIIKISGLINPASKMSAEITISCRYQYHIIQPIPSMTCTIMVRWLAWSLRSDGWAWKKYYKWNKFDQCSRCCRLQMSLRYQKVQVNDEIILVYMIYVYNWNIQMFYKSYFLVLVFCFF